MLFTKEQAQDIYADNVAWAIEEPVSRRTQMWYTFSSAVDMHLNEYANKQYGDFPNDQMTTASEDDMIHNLTRYINRAKSNARGEDDQHRDLLKIAHYASLLWGRRMGLESEEANKLADERRENNNNSLLELREAVSDMDKSLNELEDEANESN